MTKNLTDYWWLVLLRGMIALLFGLAAIAWPVDTVLAITILVGLFLIIDGIVVSILSLVSIKKNPDWWVLLLQGLIGLLIGFAIFSYPDITVKILFFLLSVWLLIMGLFLIISAIMTRKEGYGSWLLVASGIIAIMFGAFFVGNPETTFVMLTRLMGLFALISGIMTIAYSLELHSMKKDIAKAAK